MGCFSWMFADNQNINLLIGGNAYVPFPHSAFNKDCSRFYPAGTQLRETYYDGYGNFEDCDIYELVTDWNILLLNKDVIQPPYRNEWGEGDEAEAYYQKALKRYGNSVSRFLDYQVYALCLFDESLSLEERLAKAKECHEYMTEKYGTDWKRCIGIDIACYNVENASLPYPIKICRNKRSKYENIGPSNGDPNQGFY